MASYQNPIQVLLLRAYKAVLSTGLLSTDWGRSAFDTVYSWYKRFSEAGNVALLRDYVRPDTVVIDVGANVGFFTTRFAHWASGTGFVIALEPETVNYQRLIRALAKHRQTALVKPYQAVAAARSGTLRLAVNPHHPGDHKIGDSGVEVAAHALDDLLAHFNWPAVSLIKIDVQGAEAQVLEGTQQIIRRFRPAIFIEVGDEELRKFHTSAEALLSMLHSQGYEIHRLQREGVSNPLGVASAVALCRDGKYTDFLLLHPPCTSNATTCNDRNLSASPTQPEQK